MMSKKNLPILEFLESRMSLCNRNTKSVTIRKSMNICQKNQKKRKVLGEKSKSQRKRKNRKKKTMNLTQGFMMKSSRLKVT